ncbi:MAG: hypothetical protein ACJAZN_002370 [Planctomycetota bacterium]|jgi:hypothetical protein
MRLAINSPIACTRAASRWRALPTQTPRPIDFWRACGQPICDRVDSDLAGSYAALAGALAEFGIAFLRVVEAFKGSSSSAPPTSPRRLHLRTPVRELVREILCGGVADS